MKEVYLLKSKAEDAQSLHAYNMTVAAPLGRRIERLRCDKSGEYTGVSERDGQTLATITRCLMKDRNFPPLMWCELFFTAAYLANRLLHSALGGDTPYFRMHNKEADLTGLRAIGARAFVHPETYTKQLDDRAFEGKLCGFSQDSKAYRILNPSKGTVVECRNVTFIETPAYTAQLLMIAGKTRHINVSGTMDSAHSDGDTFDTPRAFRWSPGAKRILGGGRSGNQDSEYLQGRHRLTPERSVARSHRQGNEQPEEARGVQPGPHHQRTQRGEDHRVKLRLQAES